MSNRMDDVRRTLQFIILVGLVKLSSQSCEKQHQVRYVCNGATCRVHTVTILECEDISIDLYTKYWNEFFSRGFERISFKQSTFPELKAGFFRFPSNLIELKMSEDAIETIDPGTFSGLLKLEILDLSGNDIPTLPVGVFNSLEGLETLNVSYNNISVIEKKALSGLLKLKNLYLNDNHLSDLSPILDISKQLEILDISNNDILSFQIPNSPVNWTVLNIAGNALFEDKDMATDLFKDSVELNTLNLSSTGISNINRGTFSPLHKLEVLDLSLNRLKYLARGIFHDLILLQRLYLNGNLLTNIHYDSLPKLLEINLNDNPWSCDTLFTIAKGLPKTKIIRGTSYGSTNSFGIRCSEDIEDFSTIQSHNSSNVNIFLTEYISKVQNDFKQTMLDLKTFLNQINLNREKQQSTLEQSILKLIEGLNAERNSSSDALEVIIKLLEKSKNQQYTTSNNDSIFRDMQKTLLDISNNLKSPGKKLEQFPVNSAVQASKIPDDFQQKLFDLKNSQAQMQNNFEETLFDMKKLILSMKGTSEDAKLSIAQPSAHVGNIVNNTETIALYCIFVTLLVAVVMFLLIVYRKYKNISNNPTRRSPFDTLDAERL